MNQTREHNFFLQAWQLSILVNTSFDEINPNLISIIGWLHIFEFGFSIMCVFTTIFNHVLIVKSSKLRIMHSNLRVFLHQEIAIFYGLQICRLVLFCFAFSGSYKDVSVFGPFQILHIIRESGLMIDASAYVELTIDRVFATRDPERYEQQRKPYISCFLIICIWIFVIIIQLLRYVGSMPMIFMPVLLGISIFSTIPILLLVYKKNKFYLKHIYLLNLNKKFQIRENIKICQILIPAQIFFTVGITMFAILYVLIYITEINNLYNLSIILTTSFNFGIQVLFVFSSSAFPFLIPEMREQALYILCRRPMKLQVQRVTPVNEQKDVYFNHLQSVWKTNGPRRLSILAKS